MGDSILKHVGSYRWKSGIEYHGEFQNKQPHGKGTMAFPNGNLYVGEFVRGKRHGTGTFTWATSDGADNPSSSLLSASDSAQGWIPGTQVRPSTNSPSSSPSPSGSRGGDLSTSESSNPVDSSSSNDLILQEVAVRIGQEKYTGQFLENELHGYGVYQSMNGDIYEGEFSKGKKQGDGVLRTVQGDVYRGQFDAGRKSGFGRVEHASGHAFEGHFVADKRSGPGKFYWVNGDYYEGEYMDDKQHGKGRLHRTNGDTHEGAFKDNHICGFAIFDSPSVGLHYEGNFLNSVFHGKGLLVLADGAFYEGDFAEGEKHGFGVGFSPDSNALFREEWKHGTLFSRTPTTIVYDVRGILKKQGLQGILADKIVEVRAPAPSDPAPYSITKEVVQPAPVAASPQRTKKSHSSKTSATTSTQPTATANTGALPNLRTPSKISLPTKSTIEPRLQLNISGALNEKGGIPSEHYKVILYIFSFFKPKDLLDVGLVCKAWNFFIADSEPLWEVLSKRKWIDLHPTHKPLLPMTWRLMYQMKATLFVKEEFRHGYGTFFWPNGNRYEGEWVDNKRHGVGAMFYGNHDVFYGDFRDGRKHGTGVYKFFNGTSYEGSWEKGRLHGRVKVSYCNGDRFDGVFFRGEKMGEGTMTYAKGPVLQFVGEWRRGRREGCGLEITRSGEHIYSIWLNGNPIVELKEEPILSDEYHEWENPSTAFEEERAQQRAKRAERTLSGGQPSPPRQHAVARTQTSPQPNSPTSPHSTHANGGS